MIHSKHSPVINDEDTASPSRRPYSRLIAPWQRLTRNLRLQTTTGGQLSTAQALSWQDSTRRLYAWRRTAGATPRKFSLFENL